MANDKKEELIEAEDLISALIQQREIVSNQLAKAMAVIIRFERAQK